VTLAFQKDQAQLFKLLLASKNEDEDSKISMKQMKSMLAEASIAQEKFNMVFSILNELEGVDATAIE